MSCYWRHETLAWPPSCIGTEPDNLEHLLDHGLGLRHALMRTPTRNAELLFINPGRGILKLWRS